MFFYIFMAFMFVMILGFLTGLSLVLVKRVDMELSKKQRILIRSKRAGIFVVVYMGVFYLAYASMKGFYLKECGPNLEDVEVMKPQAEVITNYILENGIPESMMEISNLPYKWTSCSKATDGTNVEWCYFDASKNKYSTRLYFIKDQYGADISIKLYNKKSETGIYIKVAQHNNGAFEIRNHFEPYSTKDDGICNPMRM